MSTIEMVAIFIFVSVITLLCLFCTYVGFYMFVDMIKSKVSSWYGTIFVGILCFVLLLGSGILLWLQITGIHKCPECKSWSFLQTYCTECGNKLESSTFIACPNCHTDNWHENKYCSNCGTELNKEEE